MIQLTVNDRPPSTAHAHPRRRSWPGQTAEDTTKDKPATAITSEALTAVTKCRWSISRICPSLKLRIGVSDIRETAR